MHSPFGEHKYWLVEWIFQFDIWFCVYARVRLQFIWARATENHIYIYIVIVRHNKWQHMYYRLRFVLWNLFRSPNSLDDGKRRSHRPIIIWRWKKKKKPNNEKKSDSPAYRFVWEHSQSNVRERKMAKIWMRRVWGSALVKRQAEPSKVK